MSNRIQYRRDTAARWSQYNPILLEGEVGYVTDDPNQYKIGDGVHTWNELPLRGFDGQLVHTLGDSETAAMSQKGVTDQITAISKSIMGSEEVTIKEVKYGFYETGTGQWFEREGWYSSMLFKIISNKIRICNADGNVINVRANYFNEDKEWVNSVVSSGETDAEGYSYVLFATYGEYVNPKPPELTMMTEDEFKHCKVYGVMGDVNLYDKILEIENSLSYDKTPVPNHGILLNKNAKIMLLGASFAIPQNGWFELACSKLALTAINKAVDGSSICVQAKSYYNNALWTDDEFESFEALVIMHVHNQDVFEDSALKENYTDYTTSDLDNYAAAYDYLIKRYISDCYAQRLKEPSKYYNTKYGKPCQILLMTHWHDARTIFNDSIRKLSQKWSIPLVELDTNIGFTKNKPLSDGTQVSCIYVKNTENIDGVTYGWHPLTGQTEYIQRKIASIFMDYVKVL